MSTRLQATDDELRARLLACKTRRELASLLEVEYAQFAYYAYKLSDAQKFRQFTIPKRRGGVRTISAPVGPLGILLAKLAQVLTASYRVRGPVHGFARSRNVVTNAQAHQGKRLVLNVDLENFFPSIHFGRVRGMLMARPLELPPEVASAIAHICCVDKVLPQGAPTSPVLSNMVCARMDAELRRLARRFNFTYTRYADDLTFSSYGSSVPSQLCVRDDAGKAQAGRLLEAAIGTNGFRVNRAKVRLRSKAQRLEVTGLVVNGDAPNVPRSFVRQIRAMIHAWRRHGYEKAEAEYRAHYGRRHRASRNPPEYKRVIAGKLAYLAQVRGADDIVVKNLVRQVRVLRGLPALPTTEYTDPKLLGVAQNLWILESDADIVQGTAFGLHGVGLVTCAHSVRPDTVAFQWGEPGKKVPVELVATDPVLDLAVLRLKGVPPPPCTLEARVSPVNYLDRVAVWGFPGYQVGDKFNVNTGQVTGFRIVSTVRRILMNAHVIAGVSGGPVLDQSQRVIGIAVTGADTMNASADTEKHAAIPVSALKLLKAIAR